MRFQAIKARYLVKGVAGIVPEKLYKELILNVLKSTTMISILYSDTHSYGVKFMVIPSLITILKLSCRDLKSEYVSM